MGNVIPGTPFGPAWEGGGQLPPKTRTALPPNKVDSVPSLEKNLGVLF